MEFTDPVGPVEVAERLGVKRATVDTWRLRGLLPEPVTISGHPLWEWDIVKRWARDTGRLPDRHT